MISLKILAVFCLIASQESRKLSEAENEKRLEQCGKVKKSKVYNGRESEHVDAPWSVLVTTNTTGCSGTFISPRHVLTATHCVAGDKDVREWTNTSINYEFDRKNCKKHNNIIITETLASKLRITRNGTTLGRAKFLILVGFCRIADEGYLHEYHDDFMIVELSENMEYSQDLRPACVARSVKDNEAGAVLDFYGYGQNPERNEKENLNSSATLRYHQVKVKDVNKKGTQKIIDKRIFHAQSVTQMSVGCPGDSGGGSMRTIDGRVTVVGVQFRSTCTNMEREKNANEVHAAVGYYAKTICKYTGICTPDADSSNRRIPVFIAFLTVFSLSLWQ